MKIREIKAVRIGSLQAVLLASILVSAFIVAYYPVLKRLIWTWHQSEDYSHGFLIIPISLFIVWRKRDVLATIPIETSAWGAGIVMLSLLSYTAAHFGEIATLGSFSMVLFIAGSVLYLFGSRVFKEVFFALIVLCFMIPVPAQIYATATTPLQLLVSEISTVVSGVLQIPVYREGNVIHIPEKMLEVVQACSGLRSIISLLTLSAVFGYFTIKSSLLRSCLLFLAIPAAILLNIIRVLTTIMVFYYFQCDLSYGLMHEIFGVFLFFMAIAFILLGQRGLSRWDSHSVQE